MGTQFLIGTRTMKFLVVLALVAAAYAEPEAEPWWYSHYGYGYRGYASPYWNRWGYAYSPYYNWGGYRYLWKRDAEAQPEAEAEANPEAYWYGNWYGRRWGYGYGYRPYGYGYGYRRWWY